MKKIRGFLGKIISGINYVGLAVCFVMVFVVAIDVILRKVTGSKLSIKGSNEFTDYFLVLVCVLGIPVLQLKDGHVWVNMFVNKMPDRFRCFWRAVIMIVETLVVFALFWGACIKVKTFGMTARTDVLNMPKSIFAGAMALGFGEYLLIMIIDTIDLFIAGIKHKKLPTTDSTAEMLLEDFKDL